MSEHPDDSEIVKGGQEMLSQHAAQLAEHFDSVQIVATIVDEDGSVRLAAGQGNFYARLGSVQKWIEECSQRNVS